MENGTLVSNVTGGTVYHIATVEDVKAYFDAGFTFISGDDADYIAYRSAGYEADSGYSETDDDGNYANSDAIKLLNLVEAYCDAYDVAYEDARVLVKLGYLEGAMSGTPIHSEAQTKINITKFYNHLKTFKCFGGFILRDEPRGYMADTYNLWYQWLVNELGVYRDGYRLHGSLLGMGAAEVHVAGSSDDDTNYSTVEGLTEAQFTTYVEKYIAGLTGTGEEYLSFDYYPFTETITRTRSGTIIKDYSYETSYAIRSQYFQNLEIFARLANANGFKKGLCVQSTGFYNKTKYDEINGKGATSSYTYYGKVSEQQLTYQLYTALAYGYERMAYFTFMQPMTQTTAEWFTDAPYMWELQSDGTYKSVATEVYDGVKNANAEITEAATRMAGYKWLGTTYSQGTTATANVFNGTTSYAGGVLTAMTSSYDAIAGCLKDENGRFGFMVVNSDDPRLARTNAVTLTFGAGYKQVSYIENGVKKTAELTDGKITLNIGAGKGVFVTPESSDAKLTITTPANGDTSYSYEDNVKNYLEDDDANVGDYLVSGQKDAVAPITVSWENTFTDVLSYKVEYSTNRDFSEALVLELGASETSAELYNLYNATEYFVRVTAITAYGEMRAITSFTTSDIGARVMKIDGIYNVRDLGGYMTESGERTVQGRFFRGGALSDEVNHWYPQVSLTEEGGAYMRDVLGIKTDFDLRSQAENLGLTESPIPEATLEYYGVGGYTDAFTNANFAKVFTALADESRYPVYMHCTGGADRTGTVSFLVNALCGVDEATLIKDYEMTSFSIYGERNSKKTDYNFSGFLAQLKTYEGDTLSEKTENYMKSIGVSEIAIYNIKAIMFGKETKALPVNISAFDKGVTLNSSTTKATGENVIGYNGATGEVTISSSTGDNNGGTYIFVGSYGFYIRGGSFRVAQVSGDGYAESSPRKENGSLTTAKLQSGVTIGTSLTIKDDTTITATVYVDGAQNFTYDFTRVSNEIASDSAYMSVAINTAAVTTLVIAGETAESNIYAFTNGVTLNSSTTKATGENVIGYNGAIGEVTISSSTGDNNGGTYIFVGSYGFYIRGGSFRVAQVSGDGYAESSPRKENGSLTTAKLQSGVTIGMSLTIKDDTTITATVYVDGVQNFTYDFTRVSNEIASDSAYMSVAINTTAVTTLVIAGA